MQFQCVLNCHSCNKYLREKSSFQYNFCHTMASWKILVVAVILGNVVTGLSFRSKEDDDDDDSFSYSLEQPLMTFHALPLPIPPMLLPQFDQMFPPHKFLPLEKSRPPVRPTPVRLHHFHHKFHHNFPDFVTADSIMDEKPNSNEEVAGMAVRTTSGDGANDGTTMVTNQDGDVKSASTGKAHNMRQRIKMPKMKKTPGDHSIGYSYSSSSSSTTKDGKTESEGSTSTTAINDGMMQHEDTMMKKKATNCENNDDDDDWLNMNIRKPTPPTPPTIPEDFPGLSAADIMDTKPGDDEEFSGFAVRSTSGAEDGKDGTTMVTNNEGDVKTAKTGKASHNMRKKIQPMKLKSGPGSHSTSFHTSSSTSSVTVNGETVTEGESSTMATSDGLKESEMTKMKKKEKSPE